MNSRAFRKWKAKPKYASRRKAFLEGLDAKLCEFKRSNTDCESDVAAYLDPHAVKFVLDNLSISRHHGIFCKMLWLISFYEWGDFFEEPGITQALLTKIPKVPPCILLNSTSILCESDDPILQKPRMESFWSRIFFAQRKNTPEHEGICVN